LPPSTVGDYVQRAETIGLMWPLPEGLSESQLHDLLLGPGRAAPAGPLVRAAPDWPHRELIEPCDNYLQGGGAPRYWASSGWVGGRAKDKSWSM
jgi:hypothetical protein